MLAKKDAQKGWENAACCSIRIVRGVVFAVRGLVGWLIINDNIAALLLRFEKLLDGHEGLAGLQGGKATEAAKAVTLPQLHRRQHQKIS